MWFQEVKPLFLVIRAYGLIPYSFKGSKLTKSKTLSIITSIILVFHTSECLYDVCDHMTVESTLQSKILLAFRDVLTSVSFIVEGSVFLLCTKELITTIDHIERFDKIVAINFASNAVTIRALLNLAIAAFFLGMPLILEQQDFTVEKVVEIYYTIMGIGWFGTVFKFVDVISSFQRRFRHLQHMITKESACYVAELDGSYRPLRLRDVCHLHGELVAAAKKFNAMHSMALVMWIVTACLYITLEFYDFIDDSWDIGQKFWRTIWYAMPNVILLIHLFSVCHKTSASANKIGRLAFSPQSCVLRGRFINEKYEDFIMGHSFILHQLHITAGHGLFRVDLPLLGTIFGAMTTVLVILKQ